MLCTSAGTAGGAIASTGRESPTLRCIPPRWGAAKCVMIDHHTHTRRPYFWCSGPKCQELHRERGRRKVQFAPADWHTVYDPS